jgi:hypothetical protein
MSVKYDEYECSKCDCELKVRIDISKGRVLYKSDHTRYALIEQTPSGFVSVYSQRRCSGIFGLIIDNID